jgi:hypothetical protein
MTDKEILEAARKIMDKTNAKAKINKAKARPNRAVTLTFEEAWIGGNTLPNPRTRPYEAVSFKVPYELAIAFITENGDIE